MITEKTIETKVEISKSQNIRLIDVFVIAPFLFYVGYKAKGISKIERYGVYVIAGATLIYNLKNYLSNKDIETE